MQHAESDKKSSKKSKNQKSNNFRQLQITLSFMIFNPRSIPLTLKENNQKNFLYLLSDIHLLRDQT